MNDVPISRLVLYTVFTLFGAILVGRGLNIGLVLIVLSALFLQTKGDRPKQGHVKLTKWQILSVSLAITLIIGIAIYPFVVGKSAPAYSDSLKEAVRITGAFATLCVTGWVWWQWRKPKD